MFRLPARGSQRSWLVIAFAIAFFAIWARWPIPSAKLSLPSLLLSPGLVLMVAAALARRLGRVSFWVATIVVGSAPPAAIAARVVVDTLTNPIPHNLWPFDLILGGMVGSVCAALGALIGGIGARHMERKT
jgi:uncharacterized membrane protein YhhN